MRFSEVGHSRLMRRLKGPRSRHRRLAVHVGQYRHRRDPHIFDSGVDYCSVIRCDGRILQIAFQGSPRNRCECGLFFPCAHLLGILFHLGIRVATVAMDAQTSLLAAFWLKEG